MNKIIDRLTTFVQKEANERMYHKLGSVWVIQRSLSKAQAHFYAGIAVSPIKALLSTVETILGLVVGVFFAATTLALFFAQKKDLGIHLMQYGHAGFSHASLGTHALAYSLLNFVSMGLMGHYAEDQLKNHKVLI